MQRVVAQFQLAFGIARGEQVVLGRLAVRETVGGAAAKQHFRTTWRTGAERGTFAFDLFQLAEFFAAGASNGSHAILDRHREFVSFDRRHAILGLAGAPPRFVAALPSLARQPALIADEVKLAVAQGDHLSAPLMVARRANVLALNGKVRPGVFRSGERGVIVGSAQAAR